MHKPINKWSYRYNINNMYNDRKTKNYNKSKSNKCGLTTKIEKRKNSVIKNITEFFKNVIKY